MRPAARHPCYSAGRVWLPRRFVLSSARPPPAPAPRSAGSSRAWDRRSSRGTSCGKLREGVVGFEPQGGDHAPPPRDPQRNDRSSCLAPLLIGLVCGLAVPAQSRRGAAVELDVVERSNIFQQLEVRENSAVLEHQTGAVWFCGTRNSGLSCGEPRESSEVKVAPGGRRSLPVWHDDRHCAARPPGRARLQGARQRARASQGRSRTLK
jgi:hypothetical protein